MARAWGIEVSEREGMKMSERIYLDCGCCIENGERKWCPSCLSPPQGESEIARLTARIDELEEALREIIADNWQGSEWDMNPDNDCPISYAQWVATKALGGHENE